MPAKSFFLARARALLELHRWTQRTADRSDGHGIAGYRWSAESQRVAGPSALNLRKATGRPIPEGKRTRRLAGTVGTALSHTRSGRIRRSRRSRNRQTRHLERRSPEVLASIEELVCMRLSAPTEQKERSPDRQQDRLRQDGLLPFGSLLKLRTSDAGPRFFGSSATRKAVKFTEGRAVASPPARQSEPVFGETSARRSRSDADTNRDKDLPEAEISDSVCYVQCFRALGHMFGEALNPPLLRSSAPNTPTHNVILTGRLV